MKNLKDYLNESVLDSIKDKLSPDLWSNNKIKPSAKSFIINRLKTWLKTVYSKEVQNIFLLGSMAGYQYSPDADIDINFVIDVSKDRIWEIVKLLPNGHNLPNTNHPINYYAANEIKKEWKTSGPLYDMLKEKWVIKPEKESKKDTIQNYRAISEIGRFFITSAEAVIAEFNTDVANYEAYASYLQTADEHEEKDVTQLMRQKLYEIIADIDSVLILKHMVMALRREAFSDSPFEITTEIKIKDSNTSINNLIYKYLEKLGYFERMGKILDSRDKWEKKFNGF